MMVSALLEREQGSALPIRNGAFVAVVGPSGAGKDTLIAHARAALADEPQVEFVRRVITRPSDGETEDHDTLADAEFLEAQAEGAFALAWEAHGLRYGLPASVDRAIENGHVAVANVSRGALPALRQRYANVAVVEITADPGDTGGAACRPRPRIARRDPGPPGAHDRRATRPGRTPSRSTIAGRRRSPATSSSPSSARRWLSPMFRELSEQAVAYASTLSTWLSQT